MTIRILDSQYKVKKEFSSMEEYIEHIKLHPWPWYKKWWYNVVHFPREVRWWVIHRFHPRHRYHIIRTGLSPAYYDADMQMEHAIAQLVIHFFEIEDALHNPYEGENFHRYQELILLYHWFKKNKPTLSDVDREVLTEKLCLAVQLRGMLWT